MKRIAVLGDSLAGERIYGIQRFALELLRELDAMDLEDLDIELVLPAYAKAGPELSSFRQIRLVFSGQIKSAFFWRQICFPLYVKKRSAIAVDLTLGLPLFACDIAGLYDSTYENFPEDFRTVKEKLKRASYLIKAAIVARSCRRLVVISKSAGNELMRHYHLPKDTLALIPCAWQHYERIKEDDSILERLGLVSGDGTVREYFFSLGSVLYHKNLSWIVRAAEKNPGRLFLVTGSLDLSSFAKDSKISKGSNIIMTGYLPDSQVKALMRHAAAFIHPSLSEGFGIPPMEAMSVGTKLLLSSASCLPEIYSDSAVYFDPLDYESIDMATLLETECKSADKVLEKYSWKKSAKRLKKLLLSV